MSYQYTLEIKFDEIERLKSILQFLESAEIPEGKLRSILASDGTIWGQVLLENRGGAAPLELSDAEFLRACGIEQSEAA